MREAERLLDGENTPPQAITFKNFLGLFMRNESIELPALPGMDETIPFPETYKKFQESWPKMAEGLRSQVENEEKAENSEGAGNEEFPEGLVDEVDTAIAEANIPKPNLSM